jgi:hypothetical protein
VFCSRCGRAAGLYDRFCQSCGLPLNPAVNQRVIDFSSLDPRTDFRRQFALTFIFALGTAFFWLMQLVFPDYSSMALFGPIAGLLSLTARISFLVSFLARSANALAVSAIASTSSLVIGVLGSLPFGGYGASWPLAFTWVFSLATLVTYFIQARKVGIKPYMITRNTRSY